MITRRTMLAGGACALAAAGLPGLARAEAFHGFGPSHVGPDRPRAAMTSRERVTAATFLDAWPMVPCPA